MAFPLIILDNSSDFSQLISGKEKFSQSKLISFDFLTHEILLSRGIKHEKAEDYFETGDHELINNLAIDKSLSWYKQETISAYLQFEGFNLGWLLENELPPYFLERIKNFLVLIRVIDKEKPTLVKASDSIASIIKEIDKNGDIVIQLIPSKKNKVTFDRIPLTITMWKKNITLWMPRKLVLKLVWSVEFIIRIIFDLKFNLNDAKKRDSVLLYNLNPRPHVDLLGALSKLDKNIIFLNEQGPVVWNMNNLKIIKRFHSRIAKLDDFLSSTIQSIINKNRNELTRKIKEMSGLKNLNDFFSVEGFSFWATIKESFIDLCIRRFNEAVERYELTKELLTKTNTKCILALYNQNPEEKAVLHVSKLLNTLSIVIQHGLFVIGKHEEKLLSFDFPPFQSGVKHAVWGKKIKDYLIEQNIVDEKDILLTGNPRYDQFFRIKDSGKNNNTVLIACNFLQEYYSVSKFDTNMIIKHQKAFGEISRISNDIQDKKLVVKLHPGVIPMYDVKKILDKINSKIPVYKTQSIIDLMKDCDVLVCIDHSSILLEAMIFNKPTITFMVDSKYYEDDEIITSGATLAVKTPQEFEKALKDILFDTEFRNNLIERGTRFVNKYLVNQGNSSEFLAQVVDKYSHLG